jgi:hypothetical protein
MDMKSLTVSWIPTPVDCCYVGCSHKYIHLNHSAWFYPEVEIAIAKLKKYKLPGSDLFSKENNIPLFQVGSLR